MSSSPFTPDEIEGLKIINASATALSIFGEFFMLGCYFLFEHFQTFPMKLVTGLIFADLGYSISNMMAYLQNEPDVCTVEGYLRTTAVWSGALWILSIMWVSYRQILSFNYKMYTYFNKFLILNISLSLVPSTLSLVMGYYNPNFGFSDLFWYCALDQTLAETVLFLFPYWTFIGVALYYLYKVYLLTKSRMEGTRHIEYKEVIIYPIILITLWTPDLINRITSYIDGSPYYWLLVINILFTRMQGFVNAVAFGRRYFRFVRRKFESESSDSGSKLLSKTIEIE